MAAILSREVVRWRSGQAWMMWTNQWDENEVSGQGWGRGQGQWARTRATVVDELRLMDHMVDLLDEGVVDLMVMWSMCGGCGVCCRCAATSLMSVGWRRGRRGHREDERGDEGWQLGFVEIWFFWKGKICGWFFLIFSFDTNMMETKHNLGISS